MPDLLTMQVRGEHLDAFCLGIELQQLYLQGVESVTRQLTDIRESGSVYLPRSPLSARLCLQAIDSAELTQELPRGTLLDI